MKEKIIILTPVYNDWKSLIKLLAKINYIFTTQIKKKFDLIVVDDHSSEKINFLKLKFKNVNKLTLISLSKNFGSQRALAIGLRYINNFYKNKFKVILIDSDGQDNPKGIIEMFKKIKKFPEFPIMVNRGQRKEPFWFKFFYETYGLFINIFAGKKIRFGNYSLLNSKNLKKISNNQDLWSAFPPTVSNNIKELKYITMDREKRYAGESKMSFLKLIGHALRVFSVLKYRILFFSLIYIFSFYFFLLNTYFEFFFQYLLFIIFFLNLNNFIISLFNKKNFDIAFKKIKIKNF